jgi:hypothetical protein
LDVAAALVAFGPDPTDDAGVLEHAEMVGEQVAAQADVCGQLAGGGVAGDETVHQC